MQEEKEEKTPDQQVEPSVEFNDGFSNLVSEWSDSVSFEGDQ